MALFIDIKVLENRPEKFYFLVYLLYEERLDLKHQQWL
jgi:hypothetical protein